MAQGELSLSGDRQDQAKGRRILVIRLKSLGDIILSTVIPSAIAKAWPDAVIDYLVDPAFAGVAAAFPGVNREMVRPRDWVGRIRQMVDIQGQYDIVLDLHGSAGAAVTARFASRGSVVGWAGKRLSRLYTVAVRDGDASRHTVEVNLDMVRALGLPEPGVPELMAPRDALREARWSEEIAAPAVLLHPGARFPGKAWPSPHWRTVAEGLREKGYAPYLLVGPGESVAEEMRMLPEVRDVPAGDLVFLMHAFEGFIGTDSGPMHAAAAAGCRVVGIFGPSDPRRWRPWGPRGRFVAAECACGAGWQGPCRATAHCLDDLLPSRVLQAFSMLT